MIFEFWGRNSEISAQLKSFKSSNNLIKQEFEEYKLKASKTLQAKERTIATLKEAANGSGSSDVVDPEIQGSISSSNLRLIEIDELKNERDFFKEELQAKTSSLDMIRNDFMVFVNISKAERNTFCIELCKIF